MGGYPINSWAGGSHFEKEKTKSLTYACLYLAPYIFFMLLGSFATCTTYHFQCLKTSSKEDSKQDRWKIHFTYDTIRWTHGLVAAILEKKLNICMPIPGHIVYVIRNICHMYHCHFQCLKTLMMLSDELMGRWQPFWTKKVEHMHAYPWPHTFSMLLGTFATCTTCHFQC